MRRVRKDTSDLLSSPFEGRLSLDVTARVVEIDASKLRNAVCGSRRKIGGGDVRYLGEIDTTEAATRKFDAKLQPNTAN